MQNKDTKTWLPYMKSWYENYEFCDEPYRILGKLRSDVLLEVSKEAESQKYTRLPKLPNLNYSGIALYNESGDAKKWALKSDKNAPGYKLYVYGGYIKNVINANMVSCNLHAPKTYKLLENFTNLKRAHFAQLGTEDIHVHADNPYQTGIRIIINLTNGYNTDYDVYGHKFKINPGEIFWVNTGVPHCLVNYGTDRINLLIDVEFKENLHKELDNIVSNLQVSNFLV